VTDLRAIAEAAAADSGEWHEVGMGQNEAAHHDAWSPERALAALDVIEAVGKARDSTDWKSRITALNESITALDRWDALP
jgi:hypothetical protein